MSTQTVFLVGASGHGKVVLDALLECGFSPNHIIVADDSLDLQGKVLLGLPIMMPAIQAIASQCVFHVAIGSGRTRQKLFGELERVGSQPLAVIHPKSVISNFSSIELGVFVAAQGVIAAGAQIGRGTIINHGAIIDHDCAIGNFAHIAPNATLGGGVRVGDLALIGAGATILPQTTIGKGAIIGAGAVVLRDIGEGEICVGVPATRLRRK